MSGLVVQVKAMSFYDDWKTLLWGNASNSAEFHGSKGWFDRPKNTRANLHSLKLAGNMLVLINKLH